MPQKHVAILVETALASGREIVSGIARYARERDDWSISFHTGPLGAMASAFLENWSGDGVLARIANEQIYQLVRRTGVPVVDLLGNVERSPFPLVKCDDAAIARMVAEHFWERGHSRLAFLGVSGEQWSLARKRALQEQALARSGNNAFYELEIEHRERDPAAWSRYFDKLRSWVAGLPKPVGIMVCSDQFAPDLVQACRELGLAVPEQVSVVGVDNDLPFCELCQPRLSSVEPNHQSVGYEAAKLLDGVLQALAGPPNQVVEIQPRVLHARQSSDATALDDPALVKALRYIRSHGCENIGVDDVAREAGVSRSVLQRRFRLVLKKSVLEAILATRIARAVDMLAKTDLCLPDIAERSGFKHQEYLGYVFKKRTGRTPGDFRQHARAGGVL